MLLLGEAEEVRGEGELGLHLFLAVAEIVVADDGDDGAARVARGDLEGAAVVVELAFGPPAHAVAPLPLGRGVPCGQAELLLGEGADEVRREDHASGVAGPVPGIERGVVLRQVRITRVAEDAFHEIQVADQVPRHEEPRLHPLLGDEARHLRADDRAQVERHEAGGLVLLRCGEGQPHQRRGRLERLAQEVGEDLLGHGLLVVGDRQSALGHVEDALGRAPVGLRVVQHAVGDAVAADDVADELVPVRRQRGDAGEAGPVEQQGRRRQLRRHHRITEVIVQEGLDPRVDGAEMGGEQAVFLAAAGDERGDQRGDLGIDAGRVERKSQLGEFEVQVPDLGVRGQGVGHGLVRVMCAGAEDAHARSMVQDAGRAQDGRAQVSCASFQPLAHRSGRRREA